MRRLGLHRSRRSAAAAFALASLGAREASGQPPPQKPPDTELDVVPIAGGDSDIGWGGGAVGALTRFAPGDDRRWAWQAQASVFLTFRASPSFDVPYQDEWLQLLVPNLLGGRLRVQTRMAFTREAHIRYFGVGNATPAPPDDDSPPYVYGRTHPMIEGYARYAVSGPFYVVAGGSLTVDWLRVPVDGKLATDMANAPIEVRALLADARDHAVAVVQGSAGWDTRDSEVVPRSGSWEQFDLRLSPALAPWAPYAYAELLAIARGYVPLGDHIVVAGRALGDALVGRPPFYQLAEYLDTYAIGGTAGVRGVPAQRYYGKIKLIGNLEVRADVARFRALDKPWGIDLVAFFDAGRLWADWTSSPALDGTGLGLKWGTGLGVRLLQGTAFVVRADVAWSPDAEPIAGYFAAGEAF